MASLPNSKTVTYEEWLEMPEMDDQIEEVVSGEIRLTPPNKANHARIIENVHDVLVVPLDRQRFSVFAANIGLFA